MAAADAARGTAARDVERVAFFSDAVFAIALTLLAIDLRLPESATIVDGATLLQALADIGPQLYSFVLSFFVIVLFWRGHFRTFRLLEEVDGLTLVVNLGMLLCVVFLPFPTSVLGSHGSVPAVVVFYGLCAGAAATVSTLLWIVVAEVRHHVGDLSPAFVRRITIQSAIAPAMLIGATPLAFVDVNIPLVAWLLIAPTQLIAYRILRLDRIPPHAPASASLSAPAPASVPAAGRDGDWEPAAAARGEGRE